MTMSRKSFSRGTRGVALLAGLAGFTVSTAWPSGAAQASDPVDTAAVQVADAAAQTAPVLAAGPVDAVPANPGPADTGPADTGPADTGPAANGPTAAGTPVPVRAAPPGHQAVSVSVARTRGRNNQSLFQVSGGVRQAAEVLRLASSPAFRSLRSHYTPPSKSGRFRYEVTAHYRNGRSKTVVTYSDTPGTPQVLTDVIRGIETMPAPEFPPGFPFN